MNKRSELRLPWIRPTLGWAIGTGCVVAIACCPAQAADLSVLNATPAPSPNFGPNSPGGTNFLSSWLDMVSQTQAAQPHWITPLVTVTPRLEQEYRYDTYVTNQANGSYIANYGAGKGPEFIPTYNTEISLGVPPYERLTTANGTSASGFGDWPSVLLKYRFLSANEQSGNYILTGFLQMLAPTGFIPITNNVYVVQPTLAVGKGWGEFDIQATFSQQYPVASKGPPGTLQNYGDPFLANVAFQYHIFDYLWPEFEVNYEYWPNGTHEDLSQVLLMPGVIIGRLPISGRYNLILGAGYQFAVTSHPVTNKNWVITARMTF
jgi:hypothetical protein